MKSCCVIGCEITSEQNNTFFEFPTSRSLRRRWLDAIKLSGKLTVNSVVCSQHFVKSDYEEIRGKTRLKRKVVPTLFEKDVSEISLSPKSKLHQNSVKNVANENSNPTFVEKNIDEESVKRNLVENDIRDQSNDNTTTNNPIENLDSVPENNKTLSSPKNSAEVKNCEKFAEKSCKEISVKVSADNDEEKSNSVENKNGENNSIKRKKTRVKVVPERYPKFCDYSEDSDAHTDSEIHDTGTQEPDPKQDIEDIITNYHIKNLKPHKLASSPPPASENETALGVDEVDEEIEFQPVQEADPVFIEVPVDQDPNATEQGAGSQDCLMLLESVQVDVDPATLLLAEPDCDGEDSDNDVEETPVKHDPISLLTSSDEDDVILQEPHIDTVEVSDETDEDDIPLVRLLKKKKKESKKNKSSKKADQLNAPSNIAKIMWGLYEYYCIQCKYNTTNNADYRKHLKNHETVLHICQICGYTTSSLSLFTRHKKKHKDERHFKCHFCDYKARHNMSLVYHLKSHENDKTPVKDVKDFVCDRCGFRTGDKRNSIRHSRVCRDMKHSCDQCDYVTKRRSDLKRHKYRRHNDENNCDED